MRPLTRGMVNEWGTLCKFQAQVDIVVDINDYRFMGEQYASCSVDIRFSL